MPSQSIFMSPTSVAERSASLARQRPTSFLALIAAGGLAAAVAAVWLLVAVADILHDKTLIVKTDEAVTNWFILNGTEMGDAIFRRVSGLGGWMLFAVMVGVVAALWARHDRQRAALVVVAAGGGVALNGLLKFTFERAHSMSATTFTSAAQGLNFPSGHAINAMVSYGIIAYLLMEVVRSRGARAGIAIGGVVLVAVIGFSRIYLGIHSLAEIVLGFAGGAVWLAVCIGGYRWNLAAKHEIAPVADRGSLAAMAAI